jgi:hypothetical protein
MKYIKGLLKIAQLSKTFVLCRNLSRSYLDSIELLCFEFATIIVYCDKIAKDKNRVGN